MRGRAVMLGVAGVAVLGWAVWWVFARQFAGPMGEIRGEIERLRGQTAQVRGYLEGTKDEGSALAGLRDRALGSKAEAVVHELRVVLRAVGERAGMEGVSADSRVGRGVVNPVASVVNQGPYRGLRGVADFVPVSGSLRGTGSYESAVLALAMLSGSDRLLRVDQVRVSPVSGDDRSVLDIRIEVTTVFSPGHGPEGGALDSGWLDRMLSVDESTAGRVRVLADREPFLPAVPVAAPVVPVPAVVVESVGDPEPVREAPPPPPPPPPAYGEWRVVGVVQRLDGSAEATVVNTRTREVRRIRGGESVLGVVFVGVGVDADGPGRAIMEREGVRVRLRVGQTLGDAGEPVVESGGGGGWGG